MNENHPNWQSEYKWLFYYHYESKETCWLGENTSIENYDNVGINYYAEYAKNLWQSHLQAIFSIRPRNVCTSNHIVLTFLGRTLGMSNEYLSTRYDSAGDHMVVNTMAKETAMVAANATDCMVKTVRSNDYDRTTTYKTTTKTGCPRTTNAACNTPRLPRCDGTIHGVYHHHQHYHTESVLLPRL